MKTIHAVFPKRFHERIRKFYSKEENKENFKVINYDDDINTFKHYMLIRKEDLVVADLALLAIFEDFEVPLEVQIEEIIEKSVEVKLAHNNLRMILILPHSFKRDIKLVTELVSIGIYDIHFEIEFDFEDITEWINKPKTLADMRDYIKANAKDPREFAAIIGGLGSKEKETIIETNTEVHEVEKTRIITQKETIEKIVRLTTTIEQKKVAVLALSKGAGATFHATNFASFLAYNDLNVGLYENPKEVIHKTYLADVFNLFSELEASEQKISVPHQIVRREEHYIKDTYNVNGIDVYATNYALGPIKEFSPQYMMKYLNTGRHPIKIADLGCLTDEELAGDAFADTLALFDSVVIVVDLMPTAIIPNQRRLNSLKTLCKRYEDMNLVFMINRFDGEIPKNKYKHLDLKSPIQVEGIEQSSVIEAMFQKQTVFDYDKNIKDQLNPVYSTLSRDIGLVLRGKEEAKPKKLFAFFGK